MTDSLRAAAQAVVDEFDNYSRVAETIEALRTALAEPQECEWKKKNDWMWRLSCDGTDEEIHLARYMKFCYGCGKKIKFVENANEHTS